MKLVRTHDSFDPISAQYRIEPSEAGKEPRHFEDDLCSAVKEVLQIRSRLEILPEVVCDGETHVALEPRPIGYPMS